MVCFVSLFRSGLTCPWSILRKVMTLSPMTGLLSWLHCGHVSGGREGAREGGREGGGMEGGRERREGVREGEEKGGREGVRE